MRPNSVKSYSRRAALLVCILGSGRALAQVDAPTAPPSPPSEVPEPGTTPAAAPPDPASAPGSEAPATPIPTETVPGPPVSEPAGARPPTSPGEATAPGAGEVAVLPLEPGEAEVLAELEELEGEGEARGVSLSGFMDFNYRHLFKKDPLLDGADKNDSFFIGSANVYFRGNINARLRSLLEVRFTYLPNGARNGGPDYTRTATPDYADSDRGVALGQIEIERAHGEYEAHQLLTVRFGQFLTPYGVWNVDHGSPIVIPIGIPYAIGQSLMPERQTGFELLGRADLSDALQLRYHLTLSNGRGPFESHLDLDKNKAVGGRVQLVTQGTLGDLSVGASTYYGRYTNTLARDIQTDSAQILSQFDELTLAGDAKWTFHGVHLQAELVHQQVAYTDDGRRYLAPDSSNWGAYAIAGYRIPTVEVMPFVKYERQDDQYVDLSSWAVGLNYRPYPELAVKAAATLLDRSFDDAIEGQATWLDTQIAWAF